MDDINLKIIKHLRDGRKKYRLIAKDLDITENTVRSRVNKMIESGALRIVGIIDPAAFERHYTSYIGIKALPSKTGQVVEEISKLKGVISASCVTGRFNIIVFTLFNDDCTIKEFQLEAISKIDGILAIEQFQVLESSNSRCIYVL